jgi:hypothetical protein
MYEREIMSAVAKYFYIALCTAISHIKVEQLIKVPSILQREVLFTYLI